METHSFRIKGMCCGEEVGLLKSEVAPLIGGDERLSFDLLRSRMTIVGSLDDNVVERIRTAVARTGMEAVLSEERCSAGVCAAEVESTWEKHGRLFSCLVSGFFLLAAFIAQAILQGNILAPLAGKARPAPRSLLLSSILLQSWQELGGFSPKPFMRPGNSGLI